MDAGSLRTWLLKQPRPSTLRIVTDNGTSQKVPCPEGVRWTEVAASVMAVRPELIEAYSDDGAMLRAVRPDEEQDDEDEETEAATPDVIDVPANADAESQRLIIFARLISDAYRHSADVAFDKLAALFDAVVHRSEAQEKTISALDRLMQKMLLEKVAAAGAGRGGGESEDGGELTIESLIQSFMQGKLQGAAANGTANGTHKEPTK
jgi:hypothetical protein